MLYFGAIIKNFVCNCKINITFQSEGTTITFATKFHQLVKEETPRFVM